MIKQVGVVGVYQQNSSLNIIVFLVLLHVYTVTLLYKSTPLLQLQGFFDGCTTHKESDPCTRMTFTRGELLQAGGIPLFSAMCP